MTCPFEFAVAARRQFKVVDQTTALGVLHALSRVGDDPYREDADVKKLSGHDDL
ncbi:hypothetical protein OG223_35435 [Streptomyces sp. NBC_01478]|uniref:hypothetical protein n=1 Tax=Streptomyces sp. NBC_01478 TaxID=2903882 RepID=UPI002E33C821|nr:hypothetical protein [Streptomyces sp. NBC_01478]